MKVPYRPLGLIKEMIDTIGLEVTYVYEDLVFIQHNAFLVQMGEKGEDIGVRFNTESNPQARSELINRLSRAASPLNLIVTEQGLFQLSHEEGEENF
jgi:hypothetical protein